MPSKTLCCIISEALGCALPIRRRKNVNSNTIKEKELYDFSVTEQHSKHTALNTLPDNGNLGSTIGELTHPTLGSGLLQKSNNYIFPDSPFENKSACSDLNISPKSEFTRSSSYDTCKSISDDYSKSKSSLSSPDGYHSPKSIRSDGFITPKSTRSDGFVTPRRGSKDSADFVSMENISSDSENTLVGSQNETLTSSVIVLDNKDAHSSVEIGLHQPTNVKLDLNQSPVAASAKTSSDEILRSESETTNGRSENKVKGSHQLDSETSPVSIKVSVKPYLSPEKSKIVKEDECPPENVKEKVGLFDRLFGF